MSTWPDPHTPLAPSLLNTTSGVRDLRGVAEFGPLMQSISNARLVSTGFNEYLSKCPSAPTLNRIVWARNFMTHDLLSLPLTLPSPSAQSGLNYHSHHDSDQMMNISSPLHALYNLIRLSTMAYTLLVLFLPPHIAGIHDRLSQQLMLALDDCTVLDLWNTHPSLLLWSTILGGIVADESTLRPWFAEMARQARTRMPNLALMDSRDKDRSRSRSTGRQRSHSRSRSMPDASIKREADASWTIVRDVCFRFLWFEGPERDGFGRAFWDEACEEVLFRTRSDEPSAKVPFL